MYRHNGRYRTIGRTVSNNLTLIYHSFAQKHYAVRATKFDKIQKSFKKMSDD